MVLSPPLVFVIVLFGYVRNIGIGDAGVLIDALGYFRDHSEAVFDLFMARLDMLPHMAKAFALAANGEAPRLNGMSYVYALLHAIPRNVWPDKPPLTAALLTAITDPGPFRDGVLFYPSVVVEGAVQSRLDRHLPRRAGGRRAGPRLRPYPCRRRARRSHVGAAVIHLPDGPVQRGLPQQLCRQRAVRHGAVRWRLRAVAPDAKPRAMRTIYINGKFAAQRLTGVQRFAIEVTRALDRVLAGRTDALRFVLLLPPARRPAGG